MFELKENENFQLKNFDIFLIFAQNININCGYTLEPPSRGGSNEYPQSRFWSKNKENKYNPAYPSFAILKWGLRGYILHGHVFLMYRNETSWRTLCPSQLWKREHTEEEKQPLLSDCSGEKQPLLSDCSGNLLNRNENTTCDDKKSQPKTAAKHGANKTSVKPGVSLFKVLWKTFGMYNVVGMLCNFVNTCLSFLQPVLLK